MIDVRSATPDDLSEILAIQLESWRRTYPGLLTDEYLGEPVARDLGRTWTPDRLSGALVLVALREGRVAGFVATLPDDPDGPYVDNLHVRLADEGQGVGRALLAETARRLMALGHDRLHLTVAEGNARAAAFYARSGGHLSDPVSDDVYGQPLMALPVRWTDLSALAALA